MNRFALLTVLLLVGCGLMSTNNDGVRLWIRDGVVVNKGDATAHGAYLLYVDCATCPPDTVRVDITPPTLAPGDTGTYVASPPACWDSVFYVRTSPAP